MENDYSPRKNGVGKKIAMTGLALVLAVTGSGCVGNHPLGRGFGGNGVVYVGNYPLGPNPSENREVMRRKNEDNFKKNMDRARMNKAMEPNEDAYRNWEIPLGIGIGSFD